MGLLLGRRLLGQVILQCPKVGGAALASVIFLSVAAFLADCDVMSPLPNVPFVSQSINNLKSILVEEAVDSIFLERHAMQDKPVGMMCNKGKGRSHRNESSFVNLMPMYERNRKRVRVMCIGMDQMPEEETWGNQLVII